MGKEVFNLSNVITGYQNLFDNQDIPFFRGVASGEISPISALSSWAKITLPHDFFPPDFLARYLDSLNGFTPKIIGVNWIEPEGYEPYSTYVAIQIGESTFLRTRGDELIFAGNTREIWQWTEHFLERRKQKTLPGEVCSKTFVSLNLLPADNVGWVSGSTPAIQIDLKKGFINKAVKDLRRSGLGISLFHYQNEDEVLIAVEEQLFLKIKNKGNFDGLWTMVEIAGEKVLLNRVGKVFEGAAVSQKSPLRFVDYTRFNSDWQPESISFV